MSPVGRVRWGSREQNPQFAPRFPLLGGALVLGLVCGCRPGGTGPAEPPATPLHGPSDAVTQFEGPSAFASPDPAQGPRQRPAPSPVADRAGALAAATHGNPEGAIETLRRELAANPSDGQVRMALALALATIGQVDQAAATLEDSAGTPMDVQTVLLRVQLLRSRGRLGDAEALLTKALAANPSALELQGELVGLRVATGRREDPTTKSMIEALYDAYDARAAETAGALLAVAQAALARGGKGGFHDANMVLDEAEAKAPVDSGWVADRVRLLRGAMFLEKYAGDEAATTFGLILERDPWHPDALVGMARVELENLRFAAASRLAGEALQVDAEQPDAHAVLAQIALVEGRREEARERVEHHVLVRNPAHRRGLAVLAALAVFEGDNAAYASHRDRVLAVNPHDGGFFAELADVLGFLHLYPEADAVLREGQEFAPGDPYVQSALGLNLLRLGNEAEGRAALERSWKGDPFNERTRNVLDLYRDHLDKSYAVTVHGDLTVRLPSEDREFIAPNLVASIADARRSLDKLYGVQAGKLRTEFFATPEEFAVRTVGVPGLGAVAVCFGPVITAIGPYRGVFNLDLVVRHELAHVYAIRLSRGRVPRWFTEGLSEWESEQADPAWARESAAMLAEAKRQGRLRRLSELELAFIRAESPAMMEAAYATAAYAIRYLGHTYGRDKLIDVLTGYGAGQDTPELFRRHFGKDLAAIEQDFEKWFATQLASKLSGWTPSTDPKSGDPRDALFRAAGKQAAAKQREQASDSLTKLIDRDGDGFVPRMQLAALLLAGPKPEAARVHLEAARRFNTEAIEPIARLAELAGRAGDLPREKTLLRQALAIDADSFDPAGRLVMLALVSDDTSGFDYALARARALAPLHPMTLAADALRLAKAGDTAAARARVERASAAAAGARGRGPVDTTVVLALAHAAVGNRDQARALAKQALAGKSLPAAARKRLGAL